MERLPRNPETNESAETPEERIYQKCYLIDSEFRKLFCDSKGTTWKSHPLNCSSFQLTSTDSNFAKFTKITISASHLHPLTIATRQLFNFVRTEQQKLKCRKPRSTLHLQEIPAIHCTLCYQAGHEKFNCTNCSFCFSPTHLRLECDELKTKHGFDQNSPLITTIVKNRTSKSVAEYRLRRRALRNNFYGVWFRNCGSPRIELLDQLKPVGLYAPKQTIAIDIEGSQFPEGIGSIHVSGWFGNAIRVQTIYYDEISNPLIKNPNTWITGLQIPDLLNGTPKGVVQQNILNIITNKRIVTQGGLNELQTLDITPGDLKRNHAEHIDLQELIYSPNEPPIGLHYLDKFLFPQSQKLNRENPFNATPGHSPERDTRVTLLTYIKYIKIMTEYGQFPRPAVIRDMVKNGKSIMDWIFSLQ